MGHYPYPGPNPDDGTLEPCGIIVRTRDVNICSAINDVMPDTGFVDNAKPLCECLPWALADSQNKNLKDQWYNGDIRGALDGALMHTQEDKECLVDAGYTIQDNRLSVANSLVSKDGWTLLRAPDFDAEMHFYLVSRLDYCRTVGCESYLKDIFAPWMEKGDKIRNNELVRTMRDWVTLMGVLKKRVAAVKTAARLVQTRANSVSSKVSAVSKRVCQKNACKGKTANANLKRVNTALKTTRELRDIPAKSDEAAKRIPTITSHINSAIASFSKVPNNNHWLDLFNKGKIDSMATIMNAFGTIFEDVPRHITAVRSTMHPLIHLTKHATRGQTSLNLINGALRPNWKANKELSKTAAGRKVRDGFIQMQTIMRKELQGPVTELIKALKALDKDLAKLTLRRHKLELAQGAAGYDHWHDFEFDYPCTEIQTRVFVEDVFSASRSWPEFSPCYFTNQRIKFPRGYLPYMKYRFVKVV
ncbi:hypothetical protein ACJZ2D_000776 [Fusarium nematophilum]